jgi:hypothetical protein
MVMTRSIDRRAFLKRSGAAALGVVAAPLLTPSRAAAAGERASYTPMETNYEYVSSAG